MRTIIGCLLVATTAYAAGLSGWFEERGVEIE
jgi:hypothetical protein